VLSIGPSGSAPQVYVRLQFEEVERPPLGSPVVAVMQTAEPRGRNDAADALGRNSVLRGFFPESQMRAVLMVVIGRVGDSKDQRLWRYRDNSRNNISVGARVGIEKLQPSGWIAAVRGPAAFFVDARCDDHEHGVGKFGIVAGEEFHCRREGRAILKIGDDTLRTLIVLVKHNDLARNSAHDKREDKRSRRRPLRRYPLS
jgi:hypothetical protein